MRLSRKPLLIGSAMLVSLLVGLAVLAPLLAKRALERSFRARGWTVSIEGGRIGGRGIWFQRIAIDAKQVATMQAEIGATRIDWSSLFGMRRVSIGSGRVHVTGTLDDARDMIVGRQSGGSSGSAPRREIAYDLHNFEVHWGERLGGGLVLHASIPQLVGTSDAFDARIDSLKLAQGGLSVEMKTLTIATAVAAEGDSGTDRRKASAPAAWSAKAAETSIRYDASTPNGSGSGEGSSVPGERAIPQPTAKQPAAGDLNGGYKNGAGQKHSKADPAKVQPQSSKRELLPALSWLFDEIERLRDELTKSGGAPARHWERIPSGTKFESPALQLRIADEVQKLDLGPWPLRIARQGSELSAEVTQAGTIGKPSLSAQLTITEGFTRGTLKLAAGPVNLPQLGVTEGDFGLERIGDAKLEIDARAQFDLSRGELSVESKGWVERISIHQPFLSRETIRNLGFAWDGAVVVDAEQRQLKSEQIRLSTGPVSARLRGAVRLGRDFQTIDTSFEVPLAACQDLFDNLPDGLAPLLRGWRLDNNFAMRLSMAFDSRKPEKASIGLRLDNHCRVGSVPIDVAPSRFEQPFVLEVEDEQGALQSMSFGPGTWGWTPLSAVSPYVESAVLVCEDGRFLSHDGFDREAIQNSIRENLRTMRFARGASTVSMQLAKNLYLRRDKTIARKLQEAALTMLLEQTFAKRQLLELYLNVIEFGPGIYGIGPAARHYFETTPDRLTLAQSFFLISILPNPKANHFGPDGQLRPSWSKLLASLMRIAHRRGHFAEAELDGGLEERLAFRVPGNPTTAPAKRLLQDFRGGLDDELTLPPEPND